MKTYVVIRGVRGLQFWALHEPQSICYIMGLTKALIQD